MASFDFAPAALKTFRERPGVKKKKTPADASILSNLFSRAAVTHD
jgi:hypothetical protein